MPATPVRIGLIREGKNPPDSRVVFSPQQATRVAAYPGIELVVQPSPGRCFPDSEYQKAGLTLQEDLSNCDVLIGVKEVPTDQLIPGKTYFFFSHTHKQQAYNRGLLQAVLDNNVRLIDYELLTDGKGARVIAFGRFAGMVGAHHALRAWGLKSGNYELPQMNTFEDYEAAITAYAKTRFGDVRVVVTGTGRVGKGACEVLRDAGLQELTPESFLAGRGSGAVFTKVAVKHYVQRKDGKPFTKFDFYDNPTQFEGDFIPFMHAADVFVHGIYWDNKAPVMFTVEDLKSPAWKVQVIADVTCDIAPVTSIPTTLKSTTIADPYFGYDCQRDAETEAFAKTALTMMTVDNLPNELPRDASRAFGKMFTEKVLPELLQESSAILDRATIARNGKLTEPFEYLTSFLSGE